MLQNTQYLTQNKNFEDYRLLKYLAESFVLSALDYNDIVFHPLPLYLIKRLPLVQNAATCFVISRYATTADTVELGWPPVRERREWHLLKTTYKASHDQHWSLYMSLGVAKPQQILQSMDLMILIIPPIKGMHFRTLR